MYVCTLMLGTQIDVIRGRIQYVFFVGSLAPRTAWNIIFIANLLTGVSLVPGNPVVPQTSRLVDFSCCDFQMTRNSDERFHSCII